MTATTLAHSDPAVTIVGRDGESIVSLDDWFAHAPPAGGSGQWVDGYSAKEQAKAWLRTGAPAIPSEIASAIRDAGVGDLQSLTAYPEHETRLDAFGRGGKGNRNHDLLAVAQRSSGETVVIGVEAKACESFDGIVGTRAIAPAPSRKADRVNLLARALFGRDVCDLMAGRVLDDELAAHGYQLWTAAVGSLIEAANHQAGLAILIVQQFVPDPIAGSAPGDRRDWPTALARNDQALITFVNALGTGREALSHETAFVRAGIALRVRKANAPLAPPGPMSTRDVAGLTVADIMHADTASLPATMTVGELRHWFAISKSRRLAVIATDDHYAGSLTPPDLPPDADADRPALELAENRPTIALDAPAAAGRDLVCALDARRVPVVDSDGRLHGVLAVTTDLKFFACRPAPPPA